MILKKGDRVKQRKIESEKHTKMEIQIKLQPEVKSAIEKESKTEREKEKQRKRQVFFGPFLPWRGSQSSGTKLVEFFELRRKIAPIRL